MGEHERGFDDVADLAWTRGDVAQRAPAAGQQREPAFAQAAQPAQQGVVGAGVQVEFVAVGGLFDRGDHADPGPVVAAVGQGGQIQVGGRPVQGAEHVFAGGGQVVGRAGFDLGDPQREAVRRRQRLDVAAVLVSLSGVPRVDLGACDAGGLLAQPVAGKQLAVQDEVGGAGVVGALQGLVQVRAWAASTVMASSR